jgi:hypothetical protein
MTRRKWLIFPILAIVVLAGVSIYWLIPPRPGVTRANFHRLHKGMTLAQVEAILGSTGRKDGFAIEFWPEVGDIWEWDGEEGSLLLTIYPEVVTGGSFRTKNGASEKLGDKPEGVLELLRRWLGL